MTAPFLLRLVLPLSVAGALLAGCSSGGSSSAGGSTSTSAPKSASSPGLDCAKGDSAVTAALGTLPKVEKTGLLGVESCEWNGDEANAAVSSATLATYGAALKAVEEGTTEAVAGVGDRAFIARGYSASTTAGTGGRTLWIVKGDRVYAVAIKTGGAPPTSDQLRALAVPFVN